MASTVSSPSTTTTQSVSNTPRSVQTADQLRDEDRDDEAASDDDTLASTSTTTLTGQDEDEGMHQTPYQLKLTNMALMKEIAQLKTDKEFVWSLWKRLQVANPNIAAAMDLVVAREREKAEAKDEKVLKILTIKDKQIHDLGERVDSLKEELVVKEEEKVDAVRTAEQIRAREVDEEEKKAVEISKLQQVVEKLESEKNEFASKLNAVNEEMKNKAESSETEIRKLMRQNDKSKEEVEKTKRALEDERKKMTKSETDANILREEVKQLGDKEAKTKADYQEAKKLLEAFNGQRLKDKELMENKEMELESARQELVNLWDKHKLEVDKSKSLQGIVSQLQKLQSNTQNVIKNQEVVFNVDANNLKVNFESLKAEMREKLDNAGAERDRLKVENSALKEEVDRLTHADKDKEIQVAITARKDQIGQVNEAVMECEWEMLRLKREQSALREKLSEKNKLIHEMESLKGVENKENFPVDPVRSKKTKKIVSVDEEVEKLREKLRESQSVVDAKQNLISTLEKSHASRAKRMEELQRELEKRSREENDSVRRQDIAGLSEKMKEMIFLRNENAKVVKANIDLRDEVDVMNVRLASGNAELKAYGLKTEEIEKTYASKIQVLEVQLKDHFNLVRSHEETKARLIAANDNFKIAQNNRNSIQAENDRLSSDLHRLGSRLHETQLHQQRNAEELSRFRLEASEGKKDINRAKMLYEKERRRADDFSVKVDSMREEMEAANERWRKMLVEKDRLIAEKEKSRCDRQRDETPLHESTATEDATTESDIETLKQLKDSFQSFAARNVVQNKRGKSDIGTKKLKAVLRSRLANMKKLNSSIKTEKEVWRQKCLELQGAVAELTRRCEDQERKIAVDAECDVKEAERLAADLKQLRLQEKERKKSRQDVAEQNESLRDELNKLKSSLKQAELGKQILSKDLEVATEKLRSAEKDIQRKKILMEEYKSKIKLTSAEKEASAVASRDLEAKLASSEEAVRSAKKTVESLKTKLRKATEEDIVEKEKEFEKLREEYRVTEKALKKANRKLKESDGSLAELEQVAKREMEALVETSESKLAEMQTRLTVLSSLREKLTDEIVSFAHDANEVHRKHFQVKRSEGQRLAETRPVIAPDRVLSDAKKTAKHILQLSDDDIDDIMSSLSPNLDSDQCGNSGGSQTRSQSDGFDAKSRTWISAIQRAIESDDATSLRGLRYLLKSKLLEIVTACCDGLSHRD